MILKSHIRFVNEKIRDGFKSLKSGSDNQKELFKSINQAFRNIEENAYCGISIPKRLIPKEYIQAYGIRNLWKYDLPGGWRLLYSIRGHDVFVVSIILEWLSHKDYEKRFKY